MTLVRKEVKDKYKKETGRELTQEDVIKKMADTYVTEMRAMWPKLILQGEVENTKSKDARDRSFQLKKEIEPLTSNVEQLEVELQGLNPVGLKKIKDNLPKPLPAPSSANAPNRTTLSANQSKKVNKSSLQNTRRKLNESQKRLNAAKALYAESKSQRIASQERLETTRKKHNEPFPNVPVPAPAPVPVPVPVPIPAPVPVPVPVVKTQFKSSANLRRNVLLNAIKNKLPTASRGVRRGMEQNINQIKRTKQFPSTADQVLSRYEQTYKNKTVKRGGTRRKY